MAKEEELCYSLYEARDEKMVAKDGTCAVRIARFLKPLVRSGNQAVKVPHTPLLSEIFSDESQKWSADVVFKGCGSPHKNWEKWLDCLAKDHASVWNQSGICDAIISSRYEIRCHKDIILGLLEYWCPETNTFVFPRGEATITLEDTMHLGGLPVLGEPVTKSLTWDLVKIEEQMNGHRKEVSQNRLKKPTHRRWIDHFMGLKSEYEHIAFLSLWLSRYVFLSLPQNIIQRHVFPVAIHLSRGTKIALAPAVLASLYKNLRLLKEQATASLDSITVSGPFQVLQLWAFERFPLSISCCPNPLKSGEPRAARWHRVNSKISLPLIRLIIKLPENFRWRPYAEILNNWQHLSYYGETEEVVFEDSTSDEELQSFVRCMHSSELVGLDCKESYMPHRVAVQFGMDQDLPGEPYGSLGFTLKNIQFFVPKRMFEAGVSVRYSQWWNENKMIRKVVIEDILKQERSLQKTDPLPTVQKKRSKNDFPPLAEKVNDNSRLTRAAFRRQQEDFDDSKKTNREESGASVSTKPIDDAAEQISDDDEYDNVPISQVLKRHFAGVM